MQAKRILVVEDNLDTQFLIKRALREESYEVIAVSSPLEAFTHIETQGIPNLILLDMTFPEMSGAEFLEKLKANPQWAAIKVAIVSGIDNLRTKAREIGADSYIRKPFELDKFYDEIERLLES